MNHFFRQPLVLSRIIFSMSAIFFSALSLAEIQLYAPTNGWQNQQSKKNTYMQYPWQPQTGEAIKGQSTAHKKGAKPYKLIVNGTAIPQLVSDDGSFARPYAFAYGSNSVEIRTPDGKNRKRVQFYDNNKGTRSKLRVFLSWNTKDTIMDLHVVTPDGGHAYWANRVLPNGGAIDADVYTGYGPEIFSMPEPLAGTYLVYVNYWNDMWGTNAFEDQKQILNTAEITIITHEGSAKEKRQTFRVPVRRPGEMVLVKSFQYP